MANLSWKRKLTGKTDILFQTTMHIGYRPRDMAVNKDSLLFCLTAAAEFKKSLFDDFCFPE